MSLKELYQKNPQVVACGAIGLAVGIISTSLLFTPLDTLGLAIGAVSYSVWSFFTVAFCTKLVCTALPENLGYGFFILTPLLYLSIGLLAGWIISKVSAYAFGQESDTNALAAKKRAVFAGTIIGGIIGIIISFAVTFVHTQLAVQFVLSQVQLGANPASYAPTSEIAFNIFKFWSPALTLLGAFIGLVIGVKKVRRGL